jgi:hypothetical protein
MLRHQINYSRTSLATSDSTFASKFVAFGDHSLIHPCHVIPQGSGHFFGIFGMDPWLSRRALFVFHLISIPKPDEDTIFVVLERPVESDNSNALHLGSTLAAYPSERIWWG